MKRFLLAAVLALVVFGCARKDPPIELFRVTAVVETYIPLIEKPDAKTACLLDGMEVCRPFLERAGVVCSDGGGKFDLVFVRGDQEPGEWKRHLKRLNEDGVLVWSLDMKGVTASEFKARLEAFPCAEAHLWIPGLEEWMLVGRTAKREVRLDEALDRFVREEAFDDLVGSGCETLPELLASYVGTREQVLPAFAEGDLSAVVKPQHVLSQEVPGVAWLVQGDVEDEIFGEIEAKWRKFQLARGEVVVGGMLAEKGEVDASLEKLAAARKENPHDPLLMERIDRLEVNAHAFFKVGNVKMATSCYEAAVVINPDDPGNVRCLGQCYFMSGAREKGEALMRKADAMSFGRMRDVIRREHEEEAPADGASD